MAPPGDVNARMRRLPKVDDVLRGEAARRLLERAPRWAVVAAVRDAIDAARAQLRESDADVDLAIAETHLAARVDALVKPRLRRVLNATGVVLHTNLGRAPLARAALERVVEVSRGYSNLEYRLDEGKRGSRHEHVAEIVCELAGAEAALVVNNCAAAVLLALAALAQGREVIVSRGELVEIGGSFRVPDVMRASGARLVEVGTTNRTHPRDYERAITPETALLLKVHRSNFAVVGFTTEVSVAELAEIGGARGVPVMVDLGSGGFLPTTELGLGGEPTVPATVAAGAQVVTFSGDKLLGGPQAGILLCTRALGDRLREHPLLRALRPDKMSLAALAATLELYRDGIARDEVPTLALLATPREVLRARAERLLAKLGERAPEFRAALVETRSAVGGGALPLDEPASLALAVTHATLHPDAIDAALRRAEPPVVARIADGRLLVDVRTLQDGDLDEVAAAFAYASGGKGDPITC